MCNSRRVYVYRENGREREGEWEDDGWYDEVIDACKALLVVSLSRVIAFFCVFYFCF